ncbi:MAG: sulfite exporter TauE/SafE family protein [Myxococcota bacterium]
MNPSGLAVLVAVLGASFAGSPHCAAMCGGFVAFAAGSNLGTLWYHFGRLITYATLGAIAGAIGGGLEQVGAAAGVGQLASLIAGLLMLAFGLSALLASFGIGGPRLHLRLPFSRWLARITMRLERAPKSLRAFTLGLSTTLIPCGWLYAYVIAAGGTQSIWMGAALMSVFWLGTIPLLAGMGVLVQKAWRPLERLRPRISAVALVVVGLVSLAGRMPVPSTGEANAKEHVCHGSNPAVP